MKRNRIIALVVVLLLIVSACSSGESGSTTTTAGDTGDTTTTSGGGETTTTAGTPSGDVVEIRWFIGLGAGGQPEQRDAQIEVIDAFNASQSAIKVVAEIVDNDVAYETLATQIASGNVPDIIGPVGRDGSNAFAGLYADLEPLVEAAGVSLDRWSGPAVDGQREGDGTLVGLPFASFPSALFYNRDMFDAAGLPYPPQEYPASGVAVYGAGTEYEGPWDYNKVAEIGKMLSVDSNGVYGDEAGYDRSKAVEFGFAWQWTDRLFQQGSFWGGGYPLASNGQAEIPQAWADEWAWYQDAIWVSGFAPNQEQVNAMGNAFQSGNLAMGMTHLWYTCCIRDDANNLPGDFWDVGIAPANPNDGTVTANLHADTFRIMAGSKNQTEAFEVLWYLLTDAALPLLTAYGAAPADVTLTDAFIANLEERYPQGVNWDVFLAGAEHSEVPSHEAYLPGWEQYKAAMDVLLSGLLTDPTLDLSTAIPNLEAELTTIFSSN